MNKWAGCVYSTCCEDIYFMLEFNAVLKYKWVHGYFFEILSIFKTLC
jgi:hypothetical protein